MSTDEMHLYLAEALDQVACKETLRAALQSRVDELRLRGVAKLTLFDSLERLAGDFDETSVEVICDVLDGLVSGENQPACPPI
jgi:hypothetical protein